MIPSTVFVKRQPSEECGCPEELWLVAGIDTTIHEEADGSLHCLMDTGDQMIDAEFHGLTLETGREIALGWARAAIHFKTGWH